MQVWKGPRLSAPPAILQLVTDLVACGVLPFRVQTLKKVQE